MPVSQLQNGGSYTPSGSVFAQRKSDQERKREQRIAHLLRKASKDLAGSAPRAPPGYAARALTPTYSEPYDQFSYVDGVSDPGYVGDRIQIPLPEELQAPSDQYPYPGPEYLFGKPRLDLISGKLHIPDGVSSLQEARELLTSRTARWEFDSTQCVSKEEYVLAKSSFLTDVVAIQRSALQNLGHQMDPEKICLLKHSIQLANLECASLLNLLGPNYIKKAQLSDSTLPNFQEEPWLVDFLRQSEMESALKRIQAREASPLSQRYNDDLAQVLSGNKPLSDAMREAEDDIEELRQQKMRLQKMFNRDDIRDEEMLLRDGHEKAKEDIRDRQTKLRLTERELGDNLLRDLQTTVDETAAQLMREVVRARKIVRTESSSGADDTYSVATHNTDAMAIEMLKGIEALQGEHEFVEERRTALKSQKDRKQTGGSEQRYQSDDYDEPDDDGYGEWRGAEDEGNSKWAHGAREQESPFLFDPRAQPSMRKHPAALPRGSPMYMFDDAHIAPPYGDDYREPSPHDRRRRVARQAKKRSAEDEPWIPMRDRQRPDGGPQTTVTYPVQGDYYLPESQSDLRVYGAGSERRPERIVDQAARRAVGAQGLAWAGNTEWGAEEEYVPLDGRAQGRDWGRGPSDNYSPKGVHRRGPAGARAPLQLPADFPIPPEQQPIFQRLTEGTPSTAMPGLSSRGVSQAEPLVEPSRSAPPRYTKS